MQSWSAFPTCSATRRLVYIFDQDDQDCTKWGKIAGNLAKIIVLKPTHTVTVGAVVAVVVAVVVVVVAAAIVVVVVVVVGVVGVVGVGGAAVGLWIPRYTLNAN